MHLERLRKLDNIERRFIELLMYNASELTNILKDEYFFSRNNLIELYKKKIPTTPNKAEISNDKEKILDFLLEHYNLKDNGEVYELLKMFNIECIKI